MQVTVVGAGIGGLAVAVGLHRRGHDVTVLERSRDLTAPGAGISLFANGLAALQVLGLADDVRAVSAPYDSTLRTGQRQPSGRWLVEVPELHAGPRRRAPAGPAARAAGRAARGRGAHGHDGGRRRARARGRRRSSGGRTAADLVVGADGLRSAVRSTFAAERPPGTPATPRGGESPRVRSTCSAPRARRGAAASGSGTCHCGTDACTGSPSRASRRAPGPPTRSPRSRRRFDHWHDPIPALVAGTDPAAVLRHDIHDLDRRLPSFVQGRVARSGTPPTR